jgi:hypothetical protein
MRFSLRSMLVGITIGGLLLGVFTISREHADTVGPAVIPFAFCIPFVVAFLRTFRNRPTSTSEEPESTGVLRSLWSAILELFALISSERTTNAFGPLSDEREDARDGPRIIQPSEIILILFLTVSAAAIGVLFSDD